MILALDVGNTNIHLGLFRGEELLDQWRVSTLAGATADELGLLLAQCLRAGGFTSEDLSAAAVASVVPTLESALRAGVVRHLGVEPWFLDASRHRTLPLPHHAPSEVGADRLANALAAVSLAGAPVVVVDFGTATTVDVVSAAGEYLGGAIAPGIELSVGALFARASRLPRVDLTAPGRAIGRTTMESLQSGIILGYAGLVDRLITLVRDELGVAAPVLATGGLAPVIVPHASAVDRIEPTLTLEGIRLALRTNLSAGS